MYDVPEPPVMYEEENRSEWGIDLAGIIQFTPPDKGDLSYAQLTCSEQDKAIIQEIISTIGDEGWISLLIKQSQLKQLGAQINHVHPLKFLSTIFTSPRLRLCMKDVFSDILKRNNFMDGLTPKMEDALKKGKLEPHIKDFAAELGLPAESLLKYFQSRDWEGLVRHLMNHWSLD